MRIKGLLLIDQYGQTFKGDTIKQLKEKYGLRGKVSPMYMDTKKGDTMRVGLVIGNTWLNAYKLVQLRR
jgi:hypothetical protein